MKKKTEKINHFYSSLIGDIMSEEVKERDFAIECIKNVIKGKNGKYSTGDYIISKIDDNLYIGYRIFPQWFNHPDFYSTRTILKIYNHIK